MNKAMDFDYRDQYIDPKMAANKVLLPDFKKSTITVVFLDFLIIGELI